MAFRNQDSPFIHPILLEYSIQGEMVNCLFLEQRWVNGATFTILHTAVVRDTQKSGFFLSCSIFERYKKHLTPDHPVSPLEKKHRSARLRTAPANVASLAMLWFNHCLGILNEGEATKWTSGGEKDRDSISVKGLYIHETSFLMHFVHSYYEGYIPEQPSLKKHLLVTGNAINKNQGT